MVLTAVKRCGWALGFASEELQADREVVLAAVKQNVRAVECASEELQAEFYQKIQDFIKTLK